MTDELSRKNMWSEKYDISFELDEICLSRKRYVWNKSEISLKIPARIQRPEYVDLSAAWSWLHSLRNTSGDPYLTTILNYIFILFLDLYSRTIFDWLEPSRNFITWMDLDNYAPASIDRRHVVFTCPFVRPRLFVRKKRLYWP